MFSGKTMFSTIGRAGAVATVVAVALTAVAPSTSFAGSAAKTDSVTASIGTSGATDISARRRYYNGGGAAAAAAFAGIVGTGIAIAASQNRNDYYYGNGYGNGYGYGGGYYNAPPAYYGGGPVYYGNGYGYRYSSVPHYRGHPLASW